MTDKKVQDVNDEQAVATTVVDPSVDTIQQLEKKIIDLEMQKKDQEEITKKAQYDYINLKVDFDRYQRVTQEKEKNLEIEKTIDVAAKFLPFIEELRKVVAHIPEDKKDDPTFKWVQMISDKITKTLDTMWIKPIESVWLDVDATFHEPINAIPVEDEKMKWKIVQEYERGFIYDKNWVKKVITSSKVVIGQ